MLCDTCRNYPGIEEFEGFFHEISLSLSCPRISKNSAVSERKKFILLPSKRKPLKKPMMILITFYLLH